MAARPLVTTVLLAWARSGKQARGTIVGQAVAARRRAAVRAMALVPPGRVDWCGELLVLKVETRWPSVKAHYVDASKCAIPNLVSLSICLTDVTSVFSCFSLNAKWKYLPGDGWSAPELEGLA